MLELKLTLVHVLLFHCFWIGGPSYLFLANFQAVLQQSSTIFYSLASLKFVNSALISNPRIDSKIIILKRILVSISKLRSNSSYSTFNNDWTSNNNSRSNSNSTFNSNSTSNNNSRSNSNSTSNNNSRSNSKSTSNSS